MEIIIDPSSSLALRTSKFYFDNSQEFSWLDRYTLPAIEYGVEVEPQYIFNQSRTQLTVLFGWQAYDSRNSTFSNTQYFPVFPDEQGAVVREVHLINGNFLDNDEINWTITENVISVEWKASSYDEDTNLARYDIVQIKSPVAMSKDAFFGEPVEDMTWYEYLNSDDIIRGSWSDDFIFGYDGDDHLYGGAGNDELHGGAGSDELYGGDGNDILFAYQDYDDAELNSLDFRELLEYERIWSTDGLHGGAGDDLYVFDRMVNTPLVFENADEGNDTIVGDLQAYDLPENVENYVNDLSIDASPEGALNFIRINGNASDNIIKTSPDSWGSLDDILNTTDPFKDANEIFDGGDGNDLLISGGGIDHLYGGRGDDSLNGGYGEDILQGGDGNDELHGGAGSDELYGGDGNDILFAYQDYDDAELNSLDFQKLLEFEWVRSTDRLYGGAGDDLYVFDRMVNTPLVFENADEGNDTIVGDLQAYDLPENVENYVNDLSIDASLEGALNFIRISGNASDNIIKTSPDSWDSLSDILNTTDPFKDANEIFDGGDGNDLLISGGGIDELYGGNGDDILQGGAGNDVLAGGAGSDTADYSDKTQAIVVVLNADVQNSVSVNGVIEDSVAGIENVIGGSGNDVITGDGLRNTLIGGNGNDVLRGGGGDDVLAGGAGSDTADYSDKTQAIVVVLNADVQASVSVNGVIEDSIAGIENVIGGSGNDVITGDRLGNTLIGGGGIDRLNGGDGDDVLRGGGGDDVLAGGAGSDTADYSDKTQAIAVVLNAGVQTSVSVNGVIEDSIAGIENVIGGSGNDVITGDRLANTLIGGGGNDRLNGGDGDDVLRGGDGDDALDGGAGSDTADFSDKTQAIAVVLNAGVQTSVSVNGVVEDSSIAGIENVIGGSGNDVITGDGLRNTLIGGSGDDVLRGGGGDDVLAGGAGSDTADYSDKTQAIVVVLNADVQASVSVNGVIEDSIAGIENVIGGSGNDMITGDRLGNTLIGGGGSDTLNGGDGNDILNGGIGADKLIGGRGDDRYFVDNQRDVIVELETDDPGRETFSIGSNNDAVVASVSYTLGTNVAVEDLIAAGVLTGSSLNANLNLTGNELDQGVLGNNGANTLRGMAGEDTLVGMGGNDKLYGGEGNDMLFGGAGNDVLYGEAGNDLFAFGFGLSQGQDFNLNPINVALTGGRDQADGGNGTDTLFVSSFDPASIVIERDVSRSGYDFIVSGLNRESMQIKGIEKISFVELTSDINVSRTFNLSATSAQFTGDDDWVIGTTGNDLLQGDLGNDILQGGRGNDRLKGGQGNDVLTGGAGSDRFILDLLGGIDNVTDFTRGDKIELDDAVFSSLGANFTPGKFVNLTDSQMKLNQYQSDDYLIFNKTTKTLFYDADGSGSGQAIALAYIANVNTLSYSDFMIV